MTILNRKDIEAEIKSGKLIHNADIHNIEACSYDMTIGTIFTSDGQKINSEHQHSNEPVVIKPGEIISFFTKEELELPNDISATAFAMNSLSSKGLLVLNPGHVDPGFKGPLTVKALNLTKTPLSVEIGSEIFTVIFDRLDTATDEPYSRNEPRYIKERKFNEKNVVSAPKSLADLIVFTENNPFPTRSEINGIVSKHWSTILSLFIMVMTFIAAIVAAYNSVSTESPSDGQYNKSESSIIELKNKISYLENKIENKSHADETKNKITALENEIIGIKKNYENLKKKKSVGVK